MKTIAFHSYKGGVGRTLTLANFAKALMCAGKKIVALDLDLDAPGLHSKLNVSSVSKGYVDYLIHTTTATPRRADYIARLQISGGLYGPSVTSSLGLPYRSDVRIEDYAYVIDQSQPGSYLIPAGNSMQPGYWAYLASEAFNRRFYLKQQQVDDQNAGALLAGINIEWFERDLKKIEEKFSPDYLLIDCKTANERSSVPLMLFAEVVVSMFSNNRESLEGTALVQGGIKKNRGNGVEIISVLCRVPERFSIEDANTLRETEFKNAWNKVWPDDIAQPDDEFFVLHEYRSLETAERLLLAGDPSNGLGASLSHDYVDLFKKLAPEIEIDLVSQGKNWKSLLGMAQEVEVVEQFFELFVSGPMLNRDHQANVALRVDTLRGMMDSIYQEFLSTANNEDEKKIAGNKALQAFRNAGHAAGTSFGKEMMETDKVFANGVPDDLSERLTVWSKFDSEVGFGRITAILDDPNTIHGKVIVKNNFLTNEREQNAPDLNHFMCGYLQGVLEKLLEQVHVRVTATTSEHFTF